MADSDIAITAGSGTKIDTRTVGAGTDEHRQVMVVGDPATAAAVAAVTAANGLAVDVTRLPALVAGSNAIGKLAANDAVDIGDVTVNNGTGASAVNVQDGGNSLTVDGSVSLAAAIPVGTNNIGDVDVLTLPALPAGTNNIGDVDVLTLPALPAGNNNIGDVDVLPPTLTKNTQGATGFSVQDLKDGGRNLMAYYMAGWVAATNSVALQSLTGTKSGATVGATTTPAVVTTGKTFRITSFRVGYLQLAAAGTNAIVALRYNTAGVAATTSPVLAQLTVGGPAATAGLFQETVVEFPDGIDVPAAAGVGITVAGFNATGGAAAAGFINAAITGFEY